MLIILVEGDTIISEDSDVAETLSNYFDNAVKSLDICECRDLLAPVDGLNDPIDIAIKKYEKHPSILLIKQKVPVDFQRFSFRETTVVEMENEIKALDPKKAAAQNSIPTKILKSTSNICSSILINIWCESVSNCNFPSKLKLADITATFKSVDPTSKKNYRPVSALPCVSKVFERLMKN